MKLFELKPKVKMQELVNKLNQASDAYYNGREIITDYEYDKLLEELQKLEKQTGIILDNSPTKNVGIPVKSNKLKKVKHEFPALSLDKTKDINKILTTFDIKHSQEDEVVMMWKLDGSTIQLTYDKGRLQVAATRGDGHIGQDITYNAPYILGIPLEVKDKNKFTVRGEAVISYEDFECINYELPDDQKFKNPRNLAAGSITMLDSNDIKDRKVQFYAFELVDHPNLSDWSFSQRLSFCSKNNFQVVPNSLEGVHDGTLLFNLREDLENSHPSQCNYYLPVDGLVLAYEDTSYTDKLKGTEHHPHILKGYAFKWEDEVAETILNDIEWSPSRTGLLNPVAVFDSVELEGTTVSRASLHNYSIMKKLHLHIGDTIKVIKSNKIIPQVIENISDSSEYVYDTFGSEFNVICPSCNQKGVLVTSKDNVQSVYCRNEDCPAKLIYKFEHFCERSAMNVEGLSESTIEKFVHLGYLKQFSDIYTLDKYSEEIKQLEGFGDKSWNNLWNSILNSRNTNLERLISGIGIPNIGISQAHSISEYFENDPYRFLESKYLAFSTIDGIGQIIEKSILTWLHDEIKVAEVYDLLQYLDFKYDKILDSNLILKDKVFVITGSLHKFRNRAELEEKIQQLGGKISSTVSKKTSYLVNNDKNSTSSKNRKAKELGIQIISEDQFIDMLCQKENISNE